MSLKTEFPVAGAAGPEAAPGGAAGKTTPGGAGWRSAPDPVRVLRACGWLAAGQRPLAVSAARSSHDLHRVRRADGACAVVKRVPEHAARAGRSLARELFVHRLASWLPGVARAVPRALHLDEARQVLATESLSQADDWPAPHERGELDDPRFAASLARVLAGMHRATRGLPMPPTPAVGVLGLPKSLDEATANRPLATQLLMHRIAASPPLAAVLNEGASRYSPRCVVHGDLKTENWLRRARGRACIFDWELAGQGDPAWDLGCLVAEAGVLRLRRAWRDAPGSARPWQPAVFALSGAEPALAAVWRAYVAAAGSGARCVLDLTAPAELDRVALYSLARMLHMACEWADHEQPDDDPKRASECMFALASALTAQRSTLVALMVRGWA